MPNASAEPQSKTPSADEELIDLKDPAVAAVLAWLVPGLGHWYQGRRSKALLFFVCIFSTFAYGLFIGKGRVVYASMRTYDMRLYYVAQAGVGLPAMPALVQAFRFRNDSYEASLEAQRRRGDGKNVAQMTYDAAMERYHHPQSFFDWFMVPPYVLPDPEVRRSQGQIPGDDVPDELDLINKDLNRNFELGTIYTAIAGLLNLLVIYDAWGGPMRSDPVEGSKKKKEEDESEKKPDAL